MAIRLTWRPVSPSCISIARASRSTVSWREERSSSIACSWASASSSCEVLRPSFRARQQGPAACLLRHLQLAPAQRVHRRDQQLPGPERLHQIAVGAEPEGPLRDLRVVDAGDEDHRRLRVLPGDLLDQHQPGFARHLDVAERQMESVVGELFPGLGDAGRELAAIALPERPVDQPQDLRAVVDGQDALGLRPLDRVPDGRRCARLRHRRHPRQRRSPAASEPSPADPSR